MNRELSYVGRDLEAMLFAGNYHRWILSVFAPYLGARLVEVGAGSGSFSELLAGRSFQTLTLVEPSGEMFELLRQRVQTLDAAGRIKTLKAVFADVAAEIKSSERPDSIIYVNVLEHIADDEEELRVIHGTLARGGRLFLFVPALPWLYGSFDNHIGHHRRYTLEDLTDKCRRAGFRVVHAHYFDLLGVAPWWIKYRLFKSKWMEPTAVKFYDKYVVPAAQRIENMIPPKIGKNIILVGEKTAD